jgi:RHS repeat-associated protein
LTNQVTRGYNGFGQLTSEWQSHTGLVDPATTPRVQYAYSQGSGGNHSRLTRVTYPDGYQVNYAYSGIDSAVSRPSSLSGLRAGSTAAVTLEAFKYLGAGTVIERSRPEVNITLSMVNLAGTTADAGDKYTGLDRFGRVVDQRWTKGTTATSPVIDRYGYTYDRNSNWLTRSNALAAAFSETYAYDALNQLQSFTRSGGTTTSQQWQFDALGNWTTVTTNGVAQNRTANAQNELTQVGSSALAYSTTGNLTTDAEGRTLAYDAWNRLVSVKNAAGTEVARYEYDGLNRRIVEQVGTVASPAAATAAIRDVYYSQEWQALEERVRTSPSQVATTADTRFIWSPVYVDAMVARDRNADGNATTGTGGLEQRVYALQDANWNTTAIIAATGVPGVSAGNVINRFAYTPYGEVQTLTASWTTPPAGSTPAVRWAHLFQGLEFTDVTGLAYVRHRDYSATLGRFIEMDPIGFSAGDNNWYRFVGNGPTNVVDPSGLAPEKPKSEASPQAQELMKILPSVLESLKNIARGTTDTVERGGYILHVTKNNKHEVQECTNKESGPKHFRHRHWNVDGKHYIAKPGRDGIVSTDDEPALNDYDFDRPIAFSFHTHPPVGDKWPSGGDCKGAMEQELPDVMIAYERHKETISSYAGDVYYVWISDVDGRAFEYLRIDETKAKPRPLPNRPTNRPTKRP